MESKFKKLSKAIEKLATKYGISAVWECINKTLLNEKHQHDFHNLGHDHDHNHNNDYHKKYIDEKHYEIHNHKK